MRKTLRDLQKAVKDARVAVPGLVPEFRGVAVGNDKALRFHGFVKVGADEYQIANDGGSVKVFSQVDDLAKMASKVCEAGDGKYTIKLETGALLASAVPADIIKDAQAKVLKLGKTKTMQNEVVTKLAAQLTAMAGWDVGNVGQQAKFGEVTAQKAAVLSDIAAIDAEVARLNALIGA